MTDQELQTLRNMGNEAEAAADEIETLRQQVKDLGSIDDDAAQYIDGVATTPECTEVEASAMSHHSRAMLLNVIWHHQGAGSTAGHSALAVARTFRWRNSHGSRTARWSGRDAQRLKLRGAERPAGAPC